MTCRHYNIRIPNEYLPVIGSSVKSINLAFVESGGAPTATARLLRGLEGWLLLTTKGAGSTVA